MNIYYVIDEQIAYLENGTKIMQHVSYSDNVVNLPTFIYGKEYQINWQNVKVKGSGVPSTWEKDDSYSATDVSASLVFSNNYSRHYQSQLVSIEELDVSNSEEGLPSAYSLSVSLPNKGVADVPKTGSVLFLFPDGEIERISYSGREKINNGFRFYLGDLPQRDYLESSTIGVPESFYAQGFLDVESSDVSNGLFSFDVKFMGDRLNSIMLFTDKPYLDINYMAMKVFSEDENFKEKEFLIPARIQNSVSGLRNFMFNA